VDNQQQIEVLKSEFKIDAQKKDSKLSEQMDRNEINLERALDEICHLKESMRQLREERKQDIVETGDFIKQMVDSLRQDTQRDTEQLFKVTREMGVVLSEKSSSEDLSRWRQAVEDLLDKKVNIDEVQSALNTCQEDLSANVRDIKARLNEKI
jgi:hypothetical protein